MNLYKLTTFANLFAKLAEENSTMWDDRKFYKLNSELSGSPFHGFGDVARWLSSDFNITLKKLSNTRFQVIENGTLVKNANFVLGKKDVRGEPRWEFEKVSVFIPKPKPEKRKKKEPPKKPLQFHLPLGRPEPKST